MSLASQAFRGLGALARAGARGLALGLLWGLPQMRAKMRLNSKRRISGTIEISIVTGSVREQHRDDRDDETA